MRGGLHGQQALRRQDEVHKKKNICRLLNETVACVSAYDHLSVCARVFCMSQEDYGMCFDTTKMTITSVDNCDKATKLFRLKCAARTLSNRDRALLACVPVLALLMRADPEHMPPAPIHAPKGSQHGLRQI